MLRIAALFIIVVLTGCSSIDVSTNFDADNDFTGYKTFAWMKEDTSGKEYAYDGPLDEQIRSAVDTQLESSGLTRADGPADVLVVYHAGGEQQVEAADWGSGGWWGRGGGEENTYHKGTLIVDLVDAATRKLVWRGTATRALSEEPSPGTQKDTIDKAVEKMFKKYPPT